MLDSLEHPKSCLIQRFSYPKLDVRYYTVIKILRKNITKPLRISRIHKVGKIIIERKRKVRLK